MVFELIKFFLVPLNFFNDGATELSKLERPDHLKLLFRQLAWINVLNLIEKTFEPVFYLRRWLVVLYLLLNFLKWGSGLGNKLLVQFNLKVNLSSKRVKSHGFNRGSILLVIQLDQLLLKGEAVLLGLCKLGVQVLELVAILLNCLYCVLYLLGFFFFVGTVLDVFDETLSE